MIWSTIRQRLPVSQAGPCPVVARTMGLTNGSRLPAVLDTRVAVDSFADAGLATISGASVLAVGFPSCFFSAVADFATAVFGFSTPAGFGAGAAVLAAATGAAFAGTDAVLAGTGAALAGNDAV